jgi:hypothetical protein
VWRKQFVSQVDGRKKSRRRTKQSKSNPHAHKLGQSDGQKRKTSRHRRFPKNGNSGNKNLRTIMARVIFKPPKLRRAPAMPHPKENMKTAEQQSEGTI